MKKSSKKERSSFNVTRYFILYFGTFIAAIMLTTIGFLLAGCSTSLADTSNTVSDNNSDYDEVYSENESASEYQYSGSASPSCVITEDLYENFAADGSVYISFNNTGWTTSYEGSITESDLTISATENSAADESAAGLEIQYKGSKKLKYVLSGDYTGTVFIKNKKADAAVVLNNASISSDSGAGPVLRFSSEKRTFIVVPAGTTNTLTDSRTLNQSSTMYDDKKGSIYSKGALIFTGESSSFAGGSLSVINKGYKHAIYSKDYIRIAKLTLNVTVSGTTGRDCLRSLNGVIIDDGDITLTGKGTITDDESVGIKVEGEDADEDDMTVEYTAGAGFVIINGGNLTINTVAKGITAHWKASESVIGNNAYTETANSSLLYTSFLNGTTATVPNPYVEINGGNINITTTGTPYENTSTGISCSPEGIEAKGNLTINAGLITLNCTDDAINAGGNITINGGAVYAYSSQNDAIDSNGSNGITINGGVIVAIGVKEPECAFDCDNNPFKITGGLLVGLGTNNYSGPSSCSQGTAILAQSSYGNSNRSMAILDEDENPVFVYTLPSATGSIMILSSPDFKQGEEYTVIKGAGIKGGTHFHGLYTELPEISSSGSESISFSFSSSLLYTDSNAGKNGGPQEGERPGRP